MNYEDKVNSKQIWKGREVNFDPDSSPDAWKHYKNVYRSFNEEYDFDNICFFEYIKGKYLAECDTSKASRLNAIIRTAIPLENNNRVFDACLRLSGETDFNFNDDKIEKFTKYLKNSEDVDFLKTCSEMHHTLLNFSLMQTVGNMQGIKSRGLLYDEGKYEWLDRWDSFVYMLNGYFSKDSTIKSHFEFISGYNWSDLKDYLSEFESVYDYCERIYFIEDKAFINRVIEQGKKPIENDKDVIRYMNLAKEFWAMKEFYFLKNEFLKIDSYFSDGGKTYTMEGLLSRIENDLGYGQEEGAKLISKCIERGYIIDCGNNSYTR